MMLPLAGNAIDWDVWRPSKVQDSYGVRSALLSVCERGGRTTGGVFCAPRTFEAPQIPRPVPAPNMAAPAPAMARVEMTGAGHGCSMVMKATTEMAMGAA